MPASEEGADEGLSTTGDFRFPNEAAAAAKAADVAARLIPCPVGLSGCLTVSAVVLMLIAGADTGLRLLALANEGWPCGSAPRALAVCLPDLRTLADFSVLTVC